MNTTVKVLWDQENNCRIFVQDKRFKADTMWLYAKMPVVNIVNVCILSTTEGFSWKIQMVYKKKTKWWNVEKF